ncbi:MAG: ABC transporter permease subunit [Candidatus Lokiarchaeota archaeon]|nr:ABC transporter permease subunit [Candidatus Lokiarchaeota archaeon]
MVKEQNKNIKSTFKRTIKNLKNSLFRLFKQIKKEFRLLRTDPWNLVIALLLPPGIIMLFSFMNQEAGNGSVFPVVIVSNDSNTFINPNNNYTETTWDNYTLPYIDAVNETDSLNLLAFYNTTNPEQRYSMETARKMLLNGEIKCIIVVPLEFSEMLEYELPASIECIPDSSRIADIQKILNAIYDSVNLFISANNLTPQIVLEANEEFSIPADYNASLNSNLIMILPLMIFGIANVLTILVIVKEKPIARLLLTPVKRAEVLISKYITYSLVLFFQALLILLASIFGGLYLKGSLFELFLAVYILGYTGISLGLFISSLSKSKTEANQLFFAFFIVIILLSGIFVPLGSMPIYLQVFANILPLTHGSPMVEAILAKGKTVFGFHFFVLLGISIVLNIVTFIIFYKRRYEV